MRSLVLLSVWLLASNVAAQAPRHRIDVGCQPTEKALVYLCTVSIAEATGSPVTGADISISADMPSMPMAHNVKPVRAQPVAGKAGFYEGRLELEMLGEWAVKLQLRAPRTDVVVRKFDFRKDTVAPAGAR